MTISIRQISSSSDLKKFIKFPWQIYTNDPAWVPPLIQERKDFLNPKKNPFFEHAEVALFLAEQHGNIVGRISAHIDHLHNDTHKEKTGFFGLFESIENLEVSQALLKTAEEWLKTKGMNQMRGPLSLSINEEVGLLVKGFEFPPYLLMGHNPRYYPALLEKSGLQKIKDLYCWKYDPLAPIPEPAIQIANEVRKHPGLVIREVDPKQMDRDVRIILDVFNSAWQNNWGFVPLTENEVKKAIKDFQMILDPKIALIAEVDGKPAAISLAIPDIHRAIRDLNGKLFPFGLLKLLYRLKIKKIPAARLVLLGIKREFRKEALLSALSVLLYVEMGQRGTKNGYIEGELSWTLEDNVKINNGIELIGGKHYKTYRLYQKDISL